MNDYNLFTKGLLPKEEYLPGVKRISNELLTPIAINLSNGNAESQRLAIMIYEVGSLLLENPLKLDEIINSVDVNDLERISAKTHDFPDGYIPKGYDAEGFKMFISLKEAFTGNPEGFSKFFSIPQKAVYSLGVMLYYLFLSTLEESSFVKMEKLFFS